MTTRQEQYLRHYLADAGETETTPPAQEPLALDVVTYAYPKVYEASTEGQVITARQAIDEDALRHGSDEGLKQWDIVEWQRQRLQERVDWQRQRRELEDRMLALQEQITALSEAELGARDAAASEQEVQRIHKVWDGLLEGLGHHIDELTQRLSEQYAQQEQLSKERHTEELQTLEARLQEANERAETLQEVEIALQQSRQQEQRLAEENRGLTVQRDRLKGEMEARLQASRNKNQGLRERIRRLEHCNREWEHRFDDLKNSHSWRVTAPLRAVSTRMRGTGSALRGLRRHVHKAREIIAEQGTGALLDRVYGKLTNRPLISIVVVAGPDQQRLTSTLDSLAQYPSEFRHEVIVVDDGVGLDAARLPTGLRRLKLIKYPSSRGFHRARALAAARARAACLVFVEAGVSLHGDCLNHLVRSFLAHNEAAALAPKLLLPDGRLWGAGGRLWRDGSATIRGRGDDPARADYDTPRELDFAPLTCLAVSAKQWKSVGGSATGYDTPMGEAIDLALRFQTTGTKVLYQPMAAASVGDGPDRLVRMDAESADAMRLVGKWGPLPRQTTGDDQVSPEAAPDTEPGKRILVIDYVMLTPDQDSGSLRMATILKLLQGLGYRVTFIPSNLEYDPPYGPQLEQQGIEVLYVPVIFSIPEYLERNGHRFEVILLSRADIAQWYLEPARTYAPAATILFDTVDLHFLREQRMAELEGCPERAREADARMRQEIALIEQADITLVVSPVEKELIEQHDKSARIEVLSNIHRIHGSARGYSEREGLLFIGGFRHTPNVDAVVYFVHEVLPLVRCRIPDIRLTLVGSNPTEDVWALASEHIEVTGYVPDVSDLFARARLSVAPLRYGAGVKGKVNMSMAYGVPVVATPMATEGMFLTHGKDVLVAEQPEVFAEAVVSLYQDPVLWEKLSRNGIKNLEQHFSEQTALRVLRQILPSKEQTP